VQPLRLPPLTLDGTTHPLEYDQDQIERFYLPLARWLLARLAPAGRMIVGIGGPPACGKSAFASLLSAVCCAAAGVPVAAAIGLDGWHYPNEYLDSHTVLRDGQEIPLRRLKGGPLSFDVPAVLAFLDQARALPDLAYPLYSRELHDPLPGAGQLSANQRLLLVEGNYLLLDLPPWDAFATRFDLTISISAPREVFVMALRERHLRGGKPPAAVEQHMNFSDLPNIDLVLQHSRPAAIQVRKSDARRIADILYPHKL